MKQRPAPIAGVLINGYAWSTPPDAISLGRGVRLSRSRGSALLRLYERHCISLGLDDGEPLSMPIAAVVREDLAAAEGDPYSTTFRLLNLLCISLGVPPIYVRVFFSRDNFRTAEFTERIHTPVGQQEFLTMVPDLPTDVGFVASDILHGWHTSQRLWRVGLAGGRCTRALTYFQYAWRSAYLDQVCLNLAIVLESLFAPHSGGESTHQIAFNVAQFSGGTRERRHALYRQVREFYGLRSAIVHGRPDEDRLLKATLPMRIWRQQS